MMIADLTPGQKIVDFFILRHKEMRTKRESGELYLSLELGDATGRIFGSLWNDVSHAASTLRQGQIVKVQAAVIEWHGKLHLSINKIRPATLTDDVKIDQFLPISEEAPETLLKTLTDFIDEVDEPNLKKLLSIVFKDAKITPKLMRTPGGKLWHHCYIGGLLAHTIKVVENCKALAAHYKNINISLLLAGAMLHDIGKIIEFTSEGYFDYSDEGRLHGHIAIGYHLVANWIGQINDFPAILKKELLHLILAHQGAMEHGSPVAPMTREALILNCADDLDAKLGAFERIYEREREPGRKWSNYVNLLDRFFYFGEEI